MKSLSKATVVEPITLIEEPFTITFWRKLGLAIDSFDLNAKDMRALVAYAAHLESGNIIKISQLKLSKELSLDKAQIRQSVSKFIEAGILVKYGPRLKMNWRYIARGPLIQYL